MHPTRVFFLVRLEYEELLNVLISYRSNFTLHLKYFKKISDS